METSAQTILVIDDDMGVQMFVTKTLKNEGYQVLAAADMQEALHMADACPTEIRLILTDIMLPTSNGMALAQALLAKRPSTPVLYMSGAGSEAIHALQFEGAPIGEFLEKPFSRSQLAKKVKRCYWTTSAARGSVRTPNAGVVCRGRRLAPKLRRVYRPKAPCDVATAGNHFHAAGRAPMRTQSLHFDPSATWPVLVLTALCRRSCRRTDVVFKSRRRSQVGPPSALLNMRTGHGCVAALMAASYNCGDAIFLHNRSAKKNRVTAVASLRPDPTSVVATGATRGCLRPHGFQRRKWNTCPGVSPRRAWRKRMAKPRTLRRRRTRPTSETGAMTRRGRGVAGMSAMPWPAATPAAHDTQSAASAAMVPIRLIFKGSPSSVDSQRVARRHPPLCGLRATLWNTVKSYLHR